MFKQIIFALFIFTSLILFTSCETSTSTNNPTEYEQVVNYSIQKLSNTIVEAVGPKYPIRTNGIAEWELTDASAWTSGFFPGCLWYANKLKNDSFIKDNAIIFTEGLEEQQYNTEHHDIGFMIFNSYGLAYEQTNNEEYKNVILQAANSLSTRYNPTVGCIQSWNGDFQVIIDNMMNLEILFWAAKNGGSNYFYDIAVSHAYKTMENHVRNDGSCYQLVQYNPDNGQVIARRTVQGYSDSSTWSRGQAWGIYGFTMCYRETGDINFLNTAVKIANYYLTHLPEDYIPFWDLNLPDSCNRWYKDASAATIALSALLELRNYVDNPSEYNIAIENIYNSLVENYLSKGTSSSGIINHCAYNANSNNPFDWDASTIWGDYYFMEALVRMKQFK